MLNSAIVRTVEFCTRHIWGVIIAALIVAAASATYAVRHFAIDTNVNNLISRDLPWRKGELEYQAAFPQNTKLILVVVEGPTPEQTGAATRALSQWSVEQTCSLPLRRRRRRRGVLSAESPPVPPYRTSGANQQPTRHSQTDHPCLGEGPEPERARSSAYLWSRRIEVGQAFP
jgi:hypothetical protein